jgi:hypothetical protein
MFQKALMNRRISKKLGTGERAHWLDYYLDTHKCSHDEKCRALQRRRNNVAACAKVRRK